MASVVGDIAISVGADIGPLVTGLARGEAAVTRFGAAAQASATGGMRTLAIAGGALAAAAVTAGLGLAALTRNAMDNVDAISKSARMLGIHTASLQAIAQVAEEAGVSQDLLTGSMVKMQKSISELQQGSSAQVETFQRLGLTLADLAAIPADEQLARIAEAINAVQDPAERTALTLAVFGKSGADLITMFDGYGAAVADATKFQQDFNIAVSDVEGQQIEAANDAVGRLSVALSGLGNVLAAEFAPGLADAATALADFIRGLHASEEQVNQMAVDITFDRMAESVTRVTDAASLMAATVSDPMIANALQENVRAIQLSKEAFDMGAISADEYKANVKQAVAQIDQLYEVIQSVDSVDLSDARGEISALQKVIDVAFAAAQRLAGALPGVANVGPSAMESDIRGRVIARSDLAPTASPRPQQPGVDAAFLGDGGGGGGGGRDLASELEQLRDNFKTEQQVIEEQYQERLAALEEFRQAKLLTEQEYNDLEAQAKADHEKALADLDAYRYGTSLQMASQFFGDMATAMQGGNEKMQKISRVFAAGEALINAYRAANQALADPTLPFFAKVPAMLSVLSAGMNAVNAIKSGSSSGATSIKSASTPAAAAPASPLEVRLTGFGPGDLISGGMIGSLLDRLSAEAGDRGYKIMVAA